VGQAFDSTQGVLSAPFTVNPDHTISQAVETTESGINFAASASDSSEVAMIAFNACYASVTSRMEEAKARSGAPLGLIKTFVDWHSMTKTSVPRGNWITSLE
jgi:hypothetical protein